MGVSIPRHCLICGVSCLGSRCPAHTPDRWASTRSNPGRYGTYHTQARRTLLKENPICQCSGWCGKHEGRCRSASTVRDHIINLEDGGSDAPSNTQALCARCHAVKTAAEGRKGREGRRRSA